MRKLGVPPENLDPLRYSGPRLNLTPVVQANRRPQVYDRDYPLFTYWRVGAPVSGSGDEGENWYLSRFTDAGEPGFNPGDAIWVMIGTTSSSIEFTTDDGNTVTPSLGIVDLEGDIVDNGTNVKPLFTDGATSATVKYELQVGAAVTASPMNSNDAGIVSFDDTQFVVDTSTGFVQMIGGGTPPTISFPIDANTAPGTNPVVASGTGQVTILGAAVDFHSVPIETRSRAANSFNIEVQVATDRTGAPANKNDAGICSFDDTMFTVDSNGFVQLAGGGIAVDQINVDFNTAPGTDPVLPNGSGQITVTGSTVSNATNANAPVATHSRSANTYSIEVQVAADRTGAPANKFDAGLSSYNDTQFLVDANGYVTLVGGANLPAIQTITSDDPTIVGPDASGNVDLTGEAVNNATNAKPIFVDAGTNALNIEVQVAADRTGAPANKNDAGICSFDDTAFSVDANGYVTLIVGTTGITSIGVDANTPPGTDPVLPTGGGLVTITGAQVAAATIGANAIRTNSLAANTFTIEIQRSDDVASSSVNNAGISSFDTRSFDVDTNGWVQAKTGLQPGVSNLGISYSAGTFTVLGSDGASLSASNPAYVTLQSDSTPGELITIPITANQTFTDGAAGTTATARFGVSSGVNWANDIPFFLYAVTNDAENAINFMISRSPIENRSPANTSISKTGAIINVDQSDFFSLGNITVTDYDLNTCLCIGAFRMQFTGATDSWTVQALNHNDGIGKFHEEALFTMPLGQNGAASGTYILSNAGTEPQWATQQMLYKILKSGRVFVDFQGQNINVAGVGANDVGIVLPYAPDGQQVQGYAVYTVSSSGAKNSMNFSIGGGESHTSIALASGLIPTGGTTNFTNANFATNDSLQFSISYNAYNS